jgi:hypothetical protein
MKILPSSKKISDEAMIGKKNCFLLALTTQFSDPFYRLATFRQQKLSINPLIPLNISQHLAKI